MPVKSSEHWTANSIENFTYRIAADFLAQVETKVESGEISRTELAQRLDRTPGRVSQLFNNPGNLTVTSAVRLVRAAGMKVALVAYEDNDPQNDNGPINSAIFHQCWKDMGSPTTFFALNSTTGNCFNSYANDNNFTVVHVGAKTDVVPINVGALWAAFTSGYDSDKTSSTGTPLGLTAYTAQAVTN
jgi:hypothetical protein